MNRLIIIGASGHGKVVADLAKRCGYQEIFFLDRNPEVKSCAGYPVLGSDMMAPEIPGDVFVAIGNNAIRKAIMDSLKEREFPVLVHPSAVVAEDVEIGPGSCVMANSVLNPGAAVGKGCIVNTASSVDHDCVLSDYVHVSVGAHLCGTVCVGESTWIGAGAVVSNNVSVCGNCVIGAGAVVVKDIENAGTYVGVPARVTSGKQREQ